MTRPLWQPLMSSYNSHGGESLTCEECFIVLEYYADQLAAGIDLQTLRQPVRQLLARCPQCRQDFANRLERLKANA